jgi:PAS domain S-box-containing protein
MSLEASLELATAILRANRLEDIASPLAHSMETAFDWNHVRVWTVLQVESTRVGGERVLDEVCRTGDPRWVSKLSGTRYEELGARSGAFIPIASDDGVMGVLELLSATPREPDERLMLAITEANREIAKFLDTRRAERRELAQERHARDLATRAIFTAQERFRSLFNSDVIGIVLAKFDGTFVDVNEALARMLGYSREEILALGWQAISPPGSNDADNNALYLLVTQGAMPPFEKQYIHKDGHLVPVIVGGTRLGHGESAEIAAFVIDNTRSKRAEASIARLNSELEIRVEEAQRELRSMAVHFEQKREDRQTEIARDLHDVLGGELTGLRYDTHYVMRRMDSSPAEARQRLDEMRTRLDGLTRTIRGIAMRLRPKLVDDLGLVAAIESQAIEWSQRAGIPIDVVAPASVDIEVDRATAVYRAFGELLTNTMRHAAATRVTVTLRASEARLTLEILDNGVGCPLATSETLGLIGVRERMAAFGGTFTLDSNPVGGTRAVIELPTGRSA